ncbi:hypothetical protein P175DRAFT_0503083 [Aspergillus ochraceoroseus IBT 24754]|uniref:Peroxisomal membrane protein PEX14 n=2 Tax=Aspergillus ochraceoroseus TaxID=138278 RepID=A0A2T5LTE6_9EURO|nr:uncharacterized protein P175DRAFT_0503083 [Aspergillus ochraceoroseus IBT 24754]KKK15581.1 hypothetical protein AOCH_005482 [Aspergillus ochraceoroseus]PTU19556.1 hypothetical protein P175DRAFT_0503083 [Aspergillus ochraceoroseus IBT 24754]
MSYSGPKPPSIPQWQQRNSTPSPTSDKEDNTSRAALVAQASKFLEDDSIRDASMDRKISFLESKGLTAPEIEGLLGVSRNPEATTSTTPGTETSTARSPSSSPGTTPASPSGRIATPSTARDVPPIITYPEFLVHQSKPPPLVTLQSVLYTLYGAAGLGASIYGASEYLVKPMLATLTSARHDLAQTAEENLKKLNEKLEANVSRIPPELLSSKRPDPTAAIIDDNDDDDDDTPEADVESITSDPTELFHRDIGTQTSQELSPPHDQRGSQQSSTTTTTTTDAAAATAAKDPADPDPTAAVTTHQKRLETIGSRLRDFADAQNQSTTLEDTTRSRLADLQRYLDGLLYSKNTYSATASYGAYSATSTPLEAVSATTPGVGKGEEEAISSVRAEIRGVKGALLSARNFPTSRRGGRIAGVSSYVK